MDTKELIIVGAGPFGLAAAAAAKERGLNFMILGKPMGFWKECMPKGMLLRSGFDWHFDPFEKYSFKEFMSEKNLSEETSKPIPLPLMLQYAQWFIDKRELRIEEGIVTRLENVEKIFRLTLHSGQILTAKNVLVAVGFKYFKHIPEEVSCLIPKGYFGHTIDYSDLGTLSGKRCLIIGGRQSAFETAAILRESSEAPIYLSYRHQTPKMIESDWSFMKEIDQQIAKDPKWYWNLSLGEKEEYKKKAIEAARLRLEPWLQPRIEKVGITLLPETNLRSCVEIRQGELEVRFDNDQTLHIDHIVFATGFRIDISKIPFLCAESVLPYVQTENGSPLLNDSFQSTLPGLFFTGPAAMARFGYPVGFVRGCPTAGRLAIDGMREEA